MVAVEVIIGDFRTFFVLTWTIPSCKLLCMEEDNDDELSFIRLAAVTADVVRFLMQPKETQVDKRREGSPCNDEATKQADQKEGEGLRYLDHRVKELREFERRARGE